MTRPDSTVGISKPLHSNQHASSTHYLYHYAVGFVISVGFIRLADTYNLCLLPLVQAVRPIRIRKVTLRKLFKISYRWGNATTSALTCPVAMVARVNWSLGSQQHYGLFHSACRRLNFGALWSSGFTTHVFYRLHGPLGIKCEPNIASTQNSSSTVSRRWTLFY